MKNLQEGGYLHGMVTRVRNDETLMFAIRDGYANIYYRGGNLIKITQARNAYRFSFDTKYGKGIELPAARVSDEGGTKEWVKKAPILKEAIDEYLSIHTKHEREYQQLVARENNFSGISNETDYFIADIEFADSSLGARFDMVALRWERNQRHAPKCRLAVIEMKYADGSLAGASDLQKHLDDIGEFVRQGGDSMTKFRQSVQKQFAQLRELGLVRFGPEENKLQAVIEEADDLEVIVLLANHNPRSRKLSDVIEKLTVPDGMDLKFFVASFAGYGLHSENFVSLSGFKKLLRGNVR